MASDAFITVKAERDTTLTSLTFHKAVDPSRSAARRSPAPAVALTLSASGLALRRYSGHHSVIPGLSSKAFQPEEELMPQCYVIDRAGHADRGARAQYAAGANEAVKQHGEWRWWRAQALPATSSSSLRASRRPTPMPRSQEWAAAKKQHQRVGALEGVL